MKLTIVLLYLWTGGREHVVAEFRSTDLREFAGVESKAYAACEAARRGPAFCQVKP